MMGELQTFESRALAGQIRVGSQPSYGDSSLNALFFQPEASRYNFIVPVLAHTNAAYLLDKFAKLFESAKRKGTENTQGC